MKLYHAIILGLVLSASTLAADEGKVDRLMNEVVEGMSYNEVLRAWGAPEEKIEQEAKRVSIWVYDDSQVRFLEGRLIGIEQNDPAQDNSFVAETDSNDTENAEPVVAVADILNEIMDESDK